MRGVFIFGLLAALASSASARADEPVAEIELPQLQSSRINRVIPFFAVGFPNPLNLGASMRVSTRAIASISSGWIGLSPGTKVSVHAWNIDASLRWAPWAGAFFVGLSGRYQSIGLNIKVPFLKQDDGVDSHGNLHLGGLYAVPHLGWQWSVGERLLIGFDVGLQLPIAVGGDLTVETNDASVENQNLANQIQQDSMRVAKHYASLPIPNLTLIRLSWAL